MDGQELPCHLSSSVWQIRQSWICLDPRAHYRATHRVPQRWKPLGMPRAHREWPSSSSMVLSRGRLGSLGQAEGCPPLSTDCQPLDRLITKVANCCHDIKSRMQMRISPWTQLSKRPSPFPREETKGPVSGELPCHRHPHSDRDSGKSSSCCVEVTLTDTHKERT